MNHTLRRPLACLLLVVCLLLPVLTACGGGTYRDDLTSESVSSTIVAALPAGDGYRSVGEDYISASGWGEEYTVLLDSLADRHILISEQSDMNVDEIGVLHVKDGGDVSKAKSIVEEYVTAQQLKWRDVLNAYNQAELPKVENGKVTVYGNYILYTILGDSETKTAHEAFESALKTAE